MPVQTILVPHDFSDSADAALGWANDLAKAFGAHIVLLHVVDLESQWMPTGPAVVPMSVPAEVVRGIHEHAHTALDAIAAKVPAVRRQLVRSGHTRDVILAAAEEIKADLIIMGTHGRRGVRHLFIGSVAEYAIRHAPVPVMTVRAVARGGTPAENR